MKKIRISEDKYNALLNEISWQTADDAYRKSDYDYKDYETIRNALDMIQSYLSLLNNPRKKEFNEYIERMRNEFERKMNQRDNLESFADTKFRNAHDDMGKNDYEDALNDKLRANGDSMDNFTNDEREFATHFWENKKHQKK
jgi:hypothetical protein